MAGLNDMKVAAKCACGWTTVGDAYPIVCAHCQKVVHRPGTYQLLDPVSHPAHYTTHPSKVECIQITEHMGFCLGNAIKYIWRADLKADAIEDLKKARWYLDREIAKREAKP